MREYISGEVIANRILMMRTQHKGAFLIVEGGWDVRLFKRFIDTSLCHVLDAQTKDNVLTAIGILEQRNFEGAVAIVDTDFSMLEGNQPTSRNVLLTDTHDIETMIISSPAMGKVLAEYGSQQKLAKLSKDPCSILLHTATPVGYLRWVSLKFNLGLKFEELTFSHFVDKKTLEINVPTLLKVVRNHSRRPDLDIAKLHFEMLRLKNDEHNPWQVCCGDDMICILSIGLRKKLGSCTALDTEPSRLNRALRLAYETSHFYATRLCTSIRRWEEDNGPYRLLPIS